MDLLDFDGKYFKVARDGSFAILGFAWNGLTKPTLSYATSEKYLRMACKNPAVSCLIVPEALAGSQLLTDSGKGVAICEMPDVAFTLLHNDLVKNMEEYSYIRCGTKIGKNCHIHPMASIADRGVAIGDHVTIEEFASVREGCRIGNHVTIRAGAVIGAEYGNICWDGSGRLVKMTEAGRVSVADGVEIGCHAEIGRGTFPYDQTAIGENTCIDCRAAVAHNCQIAANCYISTAACICGSVVIADGVRINPMATVTNSITVGKNATISMGAVVMENVPDGGRVTGNFAMEHSAFLADRLQRMRNI